MSIDRRTFVTSAAAASAAIATGHSVLSAPFPPGPPKVKIHAVQTGRVRVKRAQIAPTWHGLARLVAPMIESEWADWLPTYAWVIDHAEGVIVVDTGAAEHLLSLPRWHPYFQRAVCFDIQREQELGPQLRKLGIGLRDLRKVVLTHLHIDHDAGLRDVVGSTIYASRGEVDNASGLRGRLMGYLPERWPKGFDPKALDFAEAPFGPFPRSRFLTEAGDVIAVPTPGHTSHHLSVIVMEGETAIMLAGDASYSETQMLEGRIDGVGTDEDTEIESLARIAKLTRMIPTVYLPTHDPLSADRLLQRRYVTHA